MRRAKSSSTENPPHTSRLQPGLRATALFLSVLIVGLRPLTPTIETAFAINLIMDWLQLVVVCLWLMDMVLSGRLRGARTGIGIPLLLFCGAICAATITAPCKRPALLTAFAWLTDLAFLAFLASALRRPAERRLLLTTLVASAVVVALHGVHQRFIGLPAARELYQAQPEKVLAMIGLRREVQYDFHGRLESNRVFSTFLLPNSLAGFLAMVAPLCVGMGLDYWRRRDRVAVIAASAGLLTILWCLYMTKSKGGWLAFVCGMSAYGAWLCRKRLRKYAKEAALIVAGLVLIIAAAQAAGLAPPLRDYPGSLAVRRGYWKAAVKMIRDHPVLGVGLSSFRDHYSAYKNPEDGESRQAHNDYLQIAAEAGVLALVAYLWLWFALLLRGKPRRALSAAGETQARGAPWPIGASASVPIFLGAYFFAGAFASTMGVLPWLWPCVLWATWLAFSAAVLRPAAEDRVDGPSVRPALVCGLIAFLVHGLLDFDLYVRGASQSAFVVAGILLAVPRRRPGATPVLGGRGRARDSIDYRLGRIGSVMLPCSLGLLCLALLIPVSRAIEGRTYLDQAAPDEVPDALRVRRLRLSLEADPLNAEAAARLARTCYALWREGHAEDPEARSRTFATAKDFARKAIRLNPVSSSYRYELAHLLEEEYYATKRRALLLQALIAYRHAERLFPSRPRLAFDVGRMYDLRGCREEAAARFRRALDLDLPGRQYHVRNRLTPAQRKAAREFLRKFAGADEIRKPTNPGK